jgi:CRP/FNR family cyclic AMP-dependent transcriptional regulator
MGSKRVADYRELLRAGRWFRGLPELLQEKLVSVSVLREVMPGEVLFARGDSCNGMFGVLEGKLRASGTDVDGHEALLTIVEPPSWVGEIPLFDGLPRTHDLIAEGQALVVHVPQRPLYEILEAEPRYWRDLALLLTAKIRLAFVALEDNALLPAAARLIRRLVLIDRRGLRRTERSQYSSGGGEPGNAGDDARHLTTDRKPPAQGTRSRRAGSAQVWPGGDPRPQRATRGTQ